MDLQREIKSQLFSEQEWVSDLRELAQATDRLEESMDRLMGIEAKGPAIGLEEDKLKRMGPVAKEATDHLEASRNRASDSESRGAIASKQVERGNRIGGDDNTFLNSVDLRFDHS